MNRFTALLSLIVAASLPVLAALPPINPKQKVASADAIVSGKVTTASIEIDGTASHSTYQVWLSVTVDKVEKGAELVKPSDTITIHCWRLRKAQAGWVGPSGHHDIPGEGSTFRAWLTQNDQGMWVPLEPNGFELTSDSSALSFETAEKSMHKGFLFLTVIGMALILGIFLYASRGRRS